MTKTVPEDVKAAAAAIAAEAREWHSDSDLPPIPAHVVERHLQRLLSDRASRPAAVPGVKPLEWTTYVEEPFKASSIIGEYRVSHDGDEPDEWWMYPPSDKYYFTEHPNEEEAKAAAQADYEKRVLSALAAAPAAPQASTTDAEPVGAAVATSTGATQAVFSGKRVPPGTKLYAAPQAKAGTLLSNLLARIHRDGGHYEEKYGTAKASEDAEQIIAAIYAVMEEVDPAKVPHLTAAERSALGMFAKPSAASQAKVGTEELVAELTRLIIGVEHRTAREVFDIMSDRIRAALAKHGGRS